MNYFIEIAIGRISDRNIIIPEKDLGKAITQARKTDGELYRSMYSFDEEILEHMKIKKTIRSYRGNFYINDIVIDIDKGTNKDEFVHGQAREFIQTLYEDWKIDYEAMKIWYSGRGYHVTIPNIFAFTPSNFLPTECINTMKEHFDFIDTMPYMRTGLIRVGYTVNTKTNRYKIPLTSDELYKFKTEEIIKLSEKGKKRKMGKVSVDDYVGMHKDKIIKSNVDRYKDSLVKDPTANITCMQHMFNKGGEKGSRHIELLRLVSARRRGGASKEEVYLIAKAFSPDQEEYDIKRIVDDSFVKNYAYGCNDQIMIKYCDSKCVHFNQKNYTIDVQDFETMENRYVKYLASDYVDKSFNLQEVFPQISTPFWVYPGEVILFFGDTKLGKTAFAQNIAIGVKKLKTLYFNSEVSEELMFRRTMQIAHRFTENQVNVHYDINDNTLSKEVSHLKMLNTSGIDIATLKKTINAHNFDMIILDTIGGLTAGKLGEYSSKEEKIANGIKEIAQSMKKIVIMVHHVSKNAVMNSDGYKKNLTIHSAKGSSALEQLADKVIAFEGKLTDNIRVITSLGARDETLFKITTKYHHDTFSFSNFLG